MNQRLTCGHSRPIDKREHFLVPALPAQVPKISLQAQPRAAQSRWVRRAEALVVGVWRRQRPHFGILALAFFHDGAPQIFSAASSWEELSDPKLMQPEVSPQGIAGQLVGAGQECALVEAQVGLSASVGGEIETERDERAARPSRDEFLDNLCAIQAVSGSTSASRRRPSAARVRSKS